MDTAITGHTMSEGGAQAPPSRFYAFGNPGLANLLVVGGTGRDRMRLSREFHESSRLRRGPFVAASAGSANWTDVFFRFLAGRAPIDSPLHRAEGGTLFLDDVDRLDRHAQRLLLEFLNSGRSHGSRDRGWAGLFAAGTTEDLSWLVASDCFLPELHDALDKICVNLSLVA